MQRPGDKKQLAYRLSQGERGTGGSSPRGSWGRKVIDEVSGKGEKVTKKGKG